MSVKSEKAQPLRATERPVSAVFEAYWQAVHVILHTAETAESDVLQRSAGEIARRILAGNALWTFGCTHSALLVGETVYRAGGLVLANPIFAPGLWPGERPVARTSRLEKTSGFARVVAEDVPFKAGDVLLIFSTSGWNAVPVEFAQAAKARQVYVIAFTSKEYLKLRDEKHKLHLSDVADLVVDTHVPVGDVAVALPSRPDVKAGPVSTLVGAALVNALMAGVADILSASGMEPPVFRSGNVPGGAEVNAQLMEEYRDRIHYL
ncbi:MAG: sugar isomerase domain-containing protein [Firmicutes bacterium]|nr:sugar isomerase domain-containing protein [Bacillota bacterium]